ncbi:MAG: c-type cytochrome, partial [Flammeovirgaceae bacterium]
MKYKLALSLTFLFITLTNFTQKPAPFDLKASINRGKEVYTNYCVSCHMEKGEGLE